MIHTTRASVPVGVGVLLAFLLLVTASLAPAAVASKASGTSVELLAALETADEHPAGYVRTLFRHWTDADGDGCSTRAEVLIIEAQGTPQIGDDCAVSGSWRSAYDGIVTSFPGTFDIDHVVPLKEAWDSGAWQWTPVLRERFANDLGDWRSLRAVTAGSNRSKADKDPAQWLPPRIAFRCTYANDWIAVKTRWSLRVDPAERDALEDLLLLCPTKTLTVNVLATVQASPTPVPSLSPTPTPSGSEVPSPTVAPTPTPS
jgi:hypothetical protein